MRSIDDARAKRLEQIKDHYEAREQALERKAFGAPPYNPVPPESLFLTEERVAGGARRAADRRARSLRASRRRARGDCGVLRRAARAAPSPPSARREGANVFDAVVAHAARLKSDGKRVLVACWSKGAKERLATLLAEHGIGETIGVESWDEVLAAPPNATTFAVLPLETGFEAPGHRRRRRAGHSRRPAGAPRANRRRGSDVLTEVSSLAVGDLVVHADHGIGRFAGLDHHRSRGRAA